LKIFGKAIFIGFLTIFSLSYDIAYSQRQNIDEFLDWSAETNYNFVLVAIVILIFLAILANFLWSKRKGRRYSAE